VYILLPYFRRGNLQDAINANLVNHTSFPELDLLKLFRGICVALEQLHEHRVNRAAQGARRREIRVPAGQSEEEQGLMVQEEEGEGGEGVEGDVVPYAHRDIKPGIIPCLHSSSSYELG